MFHYFPLLDLCRQILIILFYLHQQLLQLYYPVKIAKKFYMTIDFYLDLHLS